MHVGDSSRRSEEIVKSLELRLSNVVAVVVVVVIVIIFISIIILSHASDVKIGTPVVTGMIRPGKIPSQTGFEPGIFLSQDGRLNH